MSLSRGTLFSQWIEAMKDFLLRLLIDEDGPTAVEYAVMLAMIIMAAIVAIRSLGTNSAASFQDSNDQMVNAWS